MKNEMKYCILFPLLLAAPLAWGQCGDTTHTTEAFDTWVSCQATASPHPDRGTGHWIKYDLGYVYNLAGLYVWNANQSGETDRGFRQVVIDYSLDGQSWTELGRYEWSEATGYQSYVGEEAAAFDDPIQARYVLITGESNWGDPSCYGLAEVKFTLDQVTRAQLVEQPSRLGLYPNPTTGLLNLELGDLHPVNLRVVDLKGRIMQEYDQDVPRQIDLSDLPKGLYFVSLRDAQGRYVSGGVVKE